MINVVCTGMEKDDLAFVKNCDMTKLLSVVVSPYCLDD